jgi:hypothetical protein
VDIIQANLAHERFHVLKQQTFPYNHHHVPNGPTPPNIWRHLTG